MAGPTMGLGPMGAFGGVLGVGAAPASTFTLPFGAMHCPICGYSGPLWHGGVSPTLGPGPAFQPWFGMGPAGYGPAYAAWAGFGGLGGLRRHGGTYSPQFVATGLPTDEEITEMIYDAMDVDPLIPYDADINVEVDSGVVTLTGTVPNKRVKAAAGDDAWWVPGVVDVRNELQVTGRHRHRREGTEE
jgi:hypothetical protein